MGPRERTDPVAVCLDADVLIAGLLSTSGASHAILVLGEMGLLSLVLPSAAVEEVRRNLGRLLPEAIPGFERFLDAVAVRVHSPTTADVGEAAAFAHAKDVPVLAAAIGARAGILVTHNVRHFQSGTGVRILRPRAFVEEVRAWMTGFGR